MYDLEIIIPAELNDEKIKRRFEDFKKYGFKNDITKKIKIFFMASHDNKQEDIEELKQGWDKNFDIEVIVTPHKHVACRIMHYYTNYMNPESARWYLQMDEDTMTNIKLLIKKLDEEYDYTGLYQMTGSLMRQISNTERRILEQIGFAHWYNGEPPDHAYEMYITSQAAMKKIKDSPDCTQYFKIRELFPEEYGDHGLGHAARMVKVYTLVSSFLAPNARFLEYFVDYNFLHIHEISRDRTREIFQWLDLTEGQKDQKPEILNFTKKYFLSWRNEKYWIAFKENKEVVNIDNRIVGVWGSTPTNNLTIFLSNDCARNNPIFILDEKTEQGMKTKDGRLEIKIFGN
jgi:hypothetical protein